MSIIAIVFLQSTRFHTTQTYIPSDDGYTFYKVAIINRNFWKEVV